jgi:hypothetical protein
MTRWLPVAQADEQRAFEVSSESAVAALTNGDAAAAEPQKVANGTQSRGLERIASLLEEIETRRELEARRSSS